MAATGMQCLGARAPGWGDERKGITRRGPRRSAQAGTGELGATAF